MTESAAQNRVRLKAAEIGAILWRNNSGALLDSNGRMVRFGLGNDSQRLNEAWKSSDLIGICPVLIGPQHIGKTIGVFMAAEIKNPAAWTGTPRSSREVAQANFLANIIAFGGMGGFVTSPEQLERMVAQWRG